MDSANNSKELREMVRVLERKFGMLEDSQMTCCSVTMAQCHALVEIGRAGKISLNELAELLDIENSSMSRTVNNLVNSDFVKRDIDPLDRRYVTISLTESGNRVFNEIEERMEQYFTGIYNKLPANKREQVLESLKILLDAIGENGCCK